MNVEHTSLKLLVVLKMTAVNSNVTRYLIFSKKKNCIISWDKHSKRNGAIIATKQKKTEKKEKR